jgi:antirestriction protein ArdC
MFLCQHLNIKNQSKQAEAYIKNWLIDSLKADTKMLWKLASEAQKAYYWALEQQKQEEIAA